MAKRAKGGGDQSDGHDAAPPNAAEARVPVGDVTPSMAQFLEIKAANPDSILWYRMGDFYELFFDDAVVASQALGIVLTKRGKHLGQDIPMCGVPVHRADEYLQRLIRKGFRVAVCEQLEDPAEARKRGSKAVVKRDVVRLVTPGTLTEDTLLDARARNYLTALFAPSSPSASDSVHALASLDISTGEFEIASVPAADLAGELVRLAPGEILLPDRLMDDKTIAACANHTGSALTPLATSFFDSMGGERTLRERLGVAELDGFGTFSRTELAAIGALLKYVDLTQIGARPVLRPPRRAGPATTLVIDAATRNSLELLRSTRGERDGSLLSAIDRTVTGPGARELANRLASPLRDAGKIGARLDAIAFLLAEPQARESLREALKGAPDLARAMSRLSLGRGDPRDLAAVRDALAAAKACGEILPRTAGAMGLPSDLAQAAASLGHDEHALADLLNRALVETPGHQRRDGGFVRAGFRADLDEAQALRDDSRRVMTSLEAKYVEQTGIKTLKVRHNNILGFFIEVGAQGARPMLAEPLSATFTHRQTMANAVRFTTVELVEVEGRIAGAAERALAIEQEVFNDLARAIAAEERSLTRLAEALAEIDVAASLAELAEEESYVRPELDESTSLAIEGGRHPVVEQALRAAKAGPFVENDCVLGGDGAGIEDSATGRIWLVTGPNMAGKSTFLRQNALITVLAQMGSFVPARRARIGIVDRLFSRVGAADDLARGRSTFMVEMIETAAILNQAGERSLVILDEIGRGTATFDGLSIAWATVEYLHDVCHCRALFATHYHELTALSGRLAEVANATIEVKEWNDEIVFLHKVRAGAADRSYGIQVAKLAGLPGPVIARAGEVLALLEKTDRRSNGAAPALDDLPLFAAARPTSPATQPQGAGPLAEALAALNPDDMSPKEALEALYRLRQLVNR
ncbi:MAG TPA: DNA mismatch repair protein MutS [Hyphomicrobiaceae bacterium]|nr:DNA mismatch repair protein MutS [Hyphomicrobiaceae bacterium]